MGDITQKIRECCSHATAFCHVSRARTRNTRCVSSVSGMMHVIMVCSAFKDEQGNQALSGWHRTTADGGGNTEHGFDG